MARFLALSLQYLEGWPALGILGLALFAGLAAVVVFGVTPSEQATATMVVPRYDASGELLRPDNFHSWVFVGASIGLSYSKESGESGPGQFHNVYVQPEAYQQYTSTGKFPEKTMFVMPVYDPAQKVSINKHGYFEGELVDLDVSVKDREHFPEGWAYFNFSGEEGKLRDKAKAFPKPMCFECHQAHGADDNVFVQFYPVLRHASHATKAEARRQ